MSIVSHLTTQDIEIKTNRKHISMAYGFEIKLHGVFNDTHLPVLNTSSSVSLIRSSVNSGPSYI